MSKSAQHSLWWLDGSNQTDKNSNSYKQQERLMNKMILLFDEFIMKAIVMTESILDSDYRETSKLEEFTQNRERLLSVIDQISQQIDWETISIDDRSELNRKIEYIKNLDLKLLSQLDQHKEEVKKEIEQTFKQKENIKGYNLSDVK